MAAAFRVWGKMGFGDGNAGHITVRDPILPGHYWYHGPSRKWLLYLHTFKDEPRGCALLVHYCAFFR